MSSLFIPNDDEIHLIVAHGVDTKQIVRERSRANYEEVLDASHRLLHLFEETMGHSHD